MFSFPSHNLTLPHFLSPLFLSLGPAQATLSSPFQDSWSIQLPPSNWLHHFPGEELGALVIPRGKSAGLIKIGVRTGTVLVGTCSFRLKLGVSPPFPPHSHPFMASHFNSLLDALVLSLNSYSPECYIPQNAYFVLSYSEGIRLVYQLFSVASQRKQNPSQLKQNRNLSSDCAVPV